MALCDLSNRNPNVLYELGLRQAYNKPVVLVKDEKTENIFDVSVISTISYSSNRLYENVIEAQEKICESLKSTGEGKDTTLIQFVRAKEASYDDVKVNKDDASNIMFQRIMKELQRLNSNKETTFKENIADLEIVELHVRAAFVTSWKDITNLINVLDETLNVHVIKIDLIEDNEDICILISEKEYRKKPSIINDVIETRIGPILSIDTMK